MWFVYVRPKGTIQNEWISNSHIKHEPKDVFVHFMAFQSDTVVLLKLITSIHSSHEFTARNNSCWTIYFNTSTILLFSLNWNFIPIIIFFLTHNLTGISVGLVDNFIHEFFSKKEYISNNVKVGPTLLINGKIVTGYKTEDHIVDTIF